MTGCTLTSDYNWYYPANLNWSFQSGGADKSWAQWQALGYDAHGGVTDPLFVSGGTNFHLQAASPAINAGADVGLTTDFAGVPVPQGSAPDIGAYEYKSGTTPPPLTYSKADLNQDSFVNLADLDILKLDFSKLTANLLNSKSDIDGDGTVTIKDVGIMMSEWK